MGQLASEEGFKITVQKERLVKTLKENRTKHSREFKESWDGYIETVRDKLQEALEKVESKGKVPNTYFLTNLSVPEDHTADYDQALEMMDWSEGDTVVLSAALFNAFIRDQWTWSGKHRSSYNTYNKG